MLLLLGLAACQPPHARILRHFAVVLDPQVRDLALLRDGQVLARLPADGIQLGVVDALSETASYDPWFEDRADVTWLHWTGAAPTDPGDLAAAATLAFDQGLQADLQVADLGDGRFEAKLLPRVKEGDPPVAMVRLRVRGDPTEGLYGLGSDVDRPEHRGEHRAMQLEADLSGESGYNEAHVPVPLLIGTTGWGLFVADRHPMTFDVATEADDLVQVTVGTGPDSDAGLTFDLYGADDPLDVVGQYWQTTGEPHLPAPWAYGPLFWRNENTDQTQVQDDLQTVRDLDLPASGMWLDRPYASGVGAFDFDPNKFDDPDAMIATAHALGYRVALWHVPYASPTGAPTQYQTATDEGYFPPGHPPVFNPWSPPVDFTNPQAQGWWQGLIQRYTNRGIDGFKLDYAEDVVLGLNGGRLPWRFADGSYERTMHATYTLLYHQAYADLLPADGGFLLCRAGTWGDQAVASVIWPGDLDATLAKHGDPATDRGGNDYVSVGGLPAALATGLSVSASGYPFYGSDTGGYRHSPPDKETFTRWFEQTALSTVMQIGNASSDVAWAPPDGSDWDAQMIDDYRTYTRLHLRLFPYVWSWATRFDTVGRPIQRPLGLAYPDLGIHPADTYLLGDALLVAPVVTASARTRDVPFPDGTWVDWWTGEVYTGAGTRTVAAPLDTLPLYLAAGGIVPMLRPTVDTLAPTTDDAVDSWANDNGVLSIRAVPGPASRFDLSDGGVITQALAGGRWTAHFTPGDDYVQGAVIEAIATRKPASVQIDGSAVDETADPTSLQDGTAGWAWTSDTGGTLWIGLPPGEHRVLVR